MDLMTREAIILPLTGQTKAEVLSEIGKIAFKLGKVSDEVGFIEALNEREGEMSTGFGNGIAIPHAKSAAVSSPGIIFGRTTEKIEWGAIDNQPVSCFLCLMSPLSGDNVHLKMLSKLSRKLVHPDFVSFLQTETSVENIYKRLTEILAG